MKNTDDIVLMPIDKLIPYARNPRKNDGVVTQMVSSIKEYGFKIPVLAKSDGTVIDGHLRLKAANKLKMKEVPVILCDEWTDAQVKAFRLMVNKSVAWAEWDDELLRLEFDDLKALDFNLELTGFELGEIADLCIDGDIEVLDGDKSAMSSGNYGQMRGDKIPISIMGIGGMLDRDLMERVRDRLIEGGADQEQDNGVLLSGIFLSWLK